MRPDGGGGDAVCEGCARRTWLLGRLAGHLERARARIGELLTLPDEALIAAVAGAGRGAVTRELTQVDAGALAAARAAQGGEAVCRCAAAYPDALRALPSPPAVLHVAGGLDRLGGDLRDGTVAIVGARRASAYGRETAYRLAAECARAGLAVVSGLALGIDASAHEGALAAAGPTIAVMPGGAERPYPAAHRRLHARVRSDGVVVSELGPGVAPRAWMFPARNRIIAALAGMTIVVQAHERSGALLTAGWGRELGRPVGAVPGRVGSPLSVGPHGLLRDGAHLVTGAGDVLDVLYGAGARRPAPRDARSRAAPGPPLDSLLEAIAEGESTSAAFARARLDVDAGLAALTTLELSGHLRRGAGGRYEVRG